MKDPKLGISDKYITFFFSISKKLTKTKQIAYHQRSGNDEICL